MWDKREKFEVPAINGSVGVGIIGRYPRVGQCKTCGLNLMKQSPTQVHPWCSRKAMRAALVEKGEQDGDL